MVFHNHTRLLFLLWRVEGLTLNLLTLVSFRGLRASFLIVYDVYMVVLCLQSHISRAKTVYCIYCVHPVASQLHLICTRKRKGDLNFWILIAIFIKSLNNI